MIEILLVVAVALMAYKMYISEKRFTEIYKNFEILEKYLNEKVKQK